MKNAEDADAKLYMNHKMFYGVRLKCVVHLTEYFTLLHLILHQENVFSSKSET